jgi:hypothetical protein
MKVEIKLTNNYSSINSSDRIVTERYTGELKIAGSNPDASKLIFFFGAENARVSSFQCTKLAFLYSWKRKTLIFYVFSVSFLFVCWFSKGRQTRFSETATASTYKKLSIIIQ